MSLFFCSSTSTYVTMSSLKALSNASIREVLLSENLARLVPESLKIYSYSVFSFKLYLFFIMLAITGS
tara:strand:+ start:3054 stop:3257 length:204 start_codon:yes stop_codon:yes gene_type:complete